MVLGVVLDDTERCSVLLSIFFFSVLTCGVYIYIYTIGVEYYSTPQVKTQ